MTQVRLTAQRLRELLVYNANTGAFIWRISRQGPGAKAGTSAGTRRADGYINIKIDGEKHWAHRLAWLYTHDFWPLHGIDHIDGDPSNNRLANLRDVTHALNIQNVRREKRNKRSGLPIGVHVNGRGFCARIVADGRAMHLGTYPTSEAARAAYLAAKAELHPGYVD